LASRHLGTHSLKYGTEREDDASISVKSVQSVPVGFDEEVPGPHVAI
jgi:hypothetical protein